MGREGEEAAGTAEVRYSQNFDRDIDSALRAGENEGNGISWVRVEGHEGMEVGMQGLRTLEGGIIQMDLRFACCRLEKSRDSRLLASIDGKRAG